MVLPLNNLSFSQINTELGRSSNATISLNDAEVRKLAAVGGTGQSTTSGTSMVAGGLRGHSRVKKTITGTYTTTDFLTLLSPQYSAAGKTYCTAVIDAGAVIGATNTSSYALTLNGNAGDVIEIVNNGIITGAGGDGSSGNSGNGADGGNALNATFPTFITNNGSIWGGGGGGGGGAAGGDGSPKPAPVGGAGGGGGAGYVPGNGGGGGSNGTTSAGGGGGFNGGTSGHGGAGGGPGLVGETTSGTGGNPGKYVVGGSNITWTVTGDRRGGAA
jgi:hypothetical protein